MMAGRISEIEMADGQGLQDSRRQISPWTFNTADSCHVAGVYKYCRRVLLSNQRLRSKHQRQKGILVLVIFISGDILCGQCTH
jgi:hypothetical protein